MGIMNPLLTVYLLFIVSSLLSSLNVVVITAVTAQVNNSGYTARSIFQWKAVQPITSAATTLSIWNPSVARVDDYSVGKIGIVFVNQSNSIAASMEAGYIVFPQRYGNNFTRFYIKWKNIAANGTVTGCFDLECPGFIPRNGTRNIFIPRNGTRNRLFPGKVGAPPIAASTIRLSIQQFNQSGNWVLSRSGSVLGEWPDSLFTAKGNARFNAAEIGGEVYDSTGDTTPRSQMGDGQLPSSSRNRGAFFYETYVTDNETLYRVPSTFMQQIFTNPACYDFDFAASLPSVSSRPALYYGGPGCST